MCDDCTRIMQPKPKKGMNKQIQIFATLFACLLTVQCLQAQARFNPKVGYNLSGIEAELQDFDAEARTGFNIGADFRFGRGLAYFAPGLHYYNVTADVKEHNFDPGSVRFSDETTIRSIKVPMNIGLKILGLRAQGGVSGTYVLGVKEVGAVNFDVEDLNRFTYGANLGVGIDLLFLTADLNYEIGLNDYFANATGSNNILSLNVGLIF